MKNELFQGFSGGLSGSPTTVYAAEIAHPQIRGKLTVLPSVTIAFGVLLIYFLGFVFQVRIEGQCLISDKISFIATILG